MQLNEKDRVALSWDREKRGTLLRLGPEQSVVRFDDKSERVILTADLVKLQCN